NCEKSRTLIVLKSRGVTASAQKACVLIAQMWAVLGKFGSRPKWLFKPVLCPVFRFSYRYQFLKLFSNNKILGKLFLSPETSILYSESYSFKNERVP
ncbi:Unknown protein, partial [Striga hermonthica]